MKAVKKHGKINQEVVCVDKQSKYNGVVKAIIHDIDQGVLQARDRLPSEKELQERFGVSRVTVRKAVDVLIEEGYVVRDYRKGTFISERITYKKKNEIVSFTKSALLRGDIPSTIVHSIDNVKPDPFLMKYLRIPAEEALTRICRTRLTNGFPLIYEESYWVTEMTGILGKAEAEGSLFQYIKKVKHITPVYSLQELDAVGASGAIAQALQVHDQFPLLRSLMVFYDAQDRPFELAFNYYRTDRCKLSMVRTLNED